MNFVFRPVAFLCTVILVLPLFGVGCDAPAKSADIPLVNTHDVSLKRGEWKNVGVGIDRKLDENINASLATLVLYRFDANVFTLSFAHATETGMISDWRMQIPEAVVIMNAEYFDASGMPSGFLIAHGTRIGSRKFDLDKSGFVIGGDSPHILSATTTVALARQSEVAQSYPFLIRDGAVTLQTETGKSARRSFVGTDAQRKLYLGVVQSGEVTLRELATYLAGLGIQWKDVLNLDGGPSTGISVKSGDWTEMVDSWTSIPNVLILRKK